MKPTPVLAALLVSACGTDPTPDAAPDALGALHCHPLAVFSDDGGVYVSTADDGAPLVCPEHPQTPEDCGELCVPLWHG